jgi:hypothetical protein
MPELLSLSTDLKYLFTDCKTEFQSTVCHCIFEAFLVDLKVFVVYLQSSFNDTTTRIPPWSWHEPNQRDKGCD